ncbi:MAG: hypothetical protein JF565_08870 [Propionibacteriales bacterium]|nr:hypothetical protein [Propionibacteriales bacterium]
MSWIALLMAGIAVADIGHSIRPVRIVPECIGAGVAVLLGVLCGLTELRDVLALVVIAAVVIAWGITVREGFGRNEASVPLALIGAAFVVAIAVAPAAGHADGVLGDWLARDPLPVLRGVDADRALMLGAAFLVQLSTGNVLVRLVLAATGTVNPLKVGGADDPQMQLKGGRLLGPMERVFILGLGLAGHLTAASIVIAAKGLLRFPELQSKPDQERIHQLTEYFLVGSFVSWLVPLGSLVLLAT